MGAAADWEQGGRPKPWTPAAGRAVIFSLGFSSLLSASPAGRCHLSRFRIGSHKSDFCCPFYFFYKAYKVTWELNWTTRVGAQVLTSKLTWLSKEKLASETHRGNGRRVCAGRPRKLSDPVQRISDALLTAVANLQLSVTSQTFRVHFRCQVLKQQHVSNWGWSDCQCLICSFFLQRSI